MDWSTSDSAMRRSSSLEPSGRLSPPTSRADLAWARLPIPTRPGFSQETPRTNTWSLVN